MWPNPQQLLPAWLRSFPVADAGGAPVLHCDRPDQPTPYW
jgi:hypothetical protein